MIDREEFLRLQAIQQQDLNQKIDNAVELLEEIIDRKIIEQINLNKTFCELSETEILCVNHDVSIDDIMGRVKSLYKDYNFKFTSCSYGNSYTITLKVDGSRQFRTECGM